MERTILRPTRISRRCSAVVRYYDHSITRPDLAEILSPIHPRVFVENKSLYVRGWPLATDTLVQSSGRVIDRFAMPVYCRGPDWRVSLDRRITVLRWQFILKVTNSSAMQVVRARGFIATDWSSQSRPVAGRSVARITVFVGPMFRDFITS